VILSKLRNSECADTEMEAEVEPSLETEQRLAAEEAAREEAARKHDAELARMAQEALAQAAEAEKRRAQQEIDLEHLRQVTSPSGVVQACDSNHNLDILDTTATLRADRKQQAAKGVEEQLEEQEDLECLRQLSAAPVYYDPALANFSHL